MTTEKFLGSLNAHKVRFVVIGAAAFPVHGYARATLDVDLFLEPREANVKRALKALDSFGFGVSELTPRDLLTKKILIRQYLLETDLHPFVAGVSFPEVWKHRVRGRIGSQSAWFAGLEDLIKMKRAARRPKDREDLRVLLKLWKRRNAATPR
jgi:predicted nucleotidyltransferase